MTEQPQQFPLPLKLDNEASLEGFHFIDGALASALQQLLVQGGETWLMLAGRPGTGKSHLLQAVVNTSLANGSTALYIDCEELLPLLPTGPADDSSAEAIVDSLFGGFDAYDLLAFDNLQLWVGQPVWERALFYLLVKLRNRQHSKIVFAASNSASHLGIELADLRSRLESCVSYRLPEPDDEARQAILQLRAKRLGLELPTEVASFIVQRYSRDMSDLMDALQRLDQLALAQKKRLTVPFVKQALAL